MKFVVVGDTVEYKLWTIPTAISTTYSQSLGPAN